MGPTCRGVVTVMILQQITQEAQKVQFWGGIFPAQSAIFMVFITFLDAPGILQRIFRIYSDLPETVSGPPEQTLGSPRRGAG